ncbi:hypothetical protein EJ04DRAFT_594746 [Polyplosphaeria fusca]|uniref:Methyltransferase domain-containing protein n=1 Tax=Polyplosphaeria fusca TaxID=682080 RepID=A0A9P4UUU1_9PLEO|nr:hypothetical protein EJ04DRAFT_594746 [Polyplosphaeria fusca]
MSIRTPQGRVIGVVILLIFILTCIPSSTPSTLTFLPSSISSRIRPERLKWSSLRDRLSLSEKTWQRSVELRHQMAGLHPDNPQIPLFPAQTLADFGKYPYTLWDFFPATWTCPHDIQRVGRLGDGGKWVCGMSLYEAIPGPADSKSAPSAADAAPVIYSFGINGESSFEAEMLERLPSAQIWGYDFSVNGWGAQIAESARDRTYFMKAGLGEKDEAQREPPFFTLPTLMAKNNHSYIDILKIDIEGNEYKALDSVMDHFEVNGEVPGVLPIGQVMIEIHVGDNKDVNFDRFSKWWERLEGMGMRPTWMEVNLMAVTLGSKKSDPRCAEYVWVNAKDGRNLLWRGLDA